MTKQDIINYVTTTPHNTNKAILNEMLDQLAGSGGGSDVSVVTIHVTNIFPEGFEPVESGTSCTAEVRIGGKPFFATLELDDTSEVAMISNHCMLANFESYANLKGCTVESVIATGGVSWDAESFVATVTGEGTMKITWKFAD